MFHHGGWLGSVLEEEYKFSELTSSPENDERYCSLSELEPFSSEPNSAALNKVKATANFDSGYSFSLVEPLVYGKHLTPGPQNIGNCVGYSHCMLLASKIAHEIFVELQPEQPLTQNEPIPYIPYSYGAGRVYIGGNRLGGDGSNCSWQIQASMEHGFLPCDASGITGDIPQGSSSTGRQFGRSKSILDQFRPQAIKFDLVDSTRVYTTDDVKKCLTEIYTPIQICSNWGFRPAVYDDNCKVWIYKASGTWSHSMQLIGWIEIKGKTFIQVRNQWGTSAHKDCTPVIPLGGFLIEPETLSRWLKSAYAATIGEIKGKAKEIINKFPF